MVRRYAYDRQGALLDSSANIATVREGEIAVQVPLGGLVIVEGKAR
jgi:hypothetical protein